jgi:hypothetical protein
MVAGRREQHGVTVKSRGSGSGRSLFTSTLDQVLSNSASMTSWVIVSVKG